MMPCLENSRVDRALTRKSIKLALKELKQKKAGVLFSEHGWHHIANISHYFSSERMKFVLWEISNYVPDLSKTITGLILSSNDLNFEEQCLSLLGLQCQESERGVVEKCIKDKLISVISKHDSKSWESREASFLCADEDYEEGEEVLTYPDL